MNKHLILSLCTLSLLGLIQSYDLPVQAIQYLNVGGTGTYPQVENMIPNSPGVWNECPAPPPGTDPSVCITSPAQCSSSLAPFDEDLTIAFRGPMQVYNVGVYVPGDNTWDLTSYWDTTNTINQNLVWMNNAGDWSICQGWAQSYVGLDGITASDDPVAFEGYLGNDVNVNIMSDVDCTSDLCPGFYRGVAKVGWSGNSCGEKMFAVTVTMPWDTTPNPTTGTNNNNLPAIWFLNGQVVRTNQWGCNCRGMGASGGCGELDIAEVVPAPWNTPYACTSTFYSFKQSLGCSDHFVRPVNSSVTYIIIFDASGTGTITILANSETFTYANSFPQADVNMWVNSANPISQVALGDPYTGQECTGLSAAGLDQEAVGRNVGAGVAIGVGVVGVVIGVVVVIVVIVVIQKRKKDSELV